MRRKALILVCVLTDLIVSCSPKQSALKVASALNGNVAMSISSEWTNHQIMHGWASDCNGCSYSEATDYFGEDSLIQIPITPPKRSYCTIGSNIQPGSFQRSILLKPDVKAEARVLKQKDPSATNEEIVASLENKTLEVSYRGQTDKGIPVYYYKSITYFGPNRRVKVSFKGKDSPEFRETVAAMCNTIRIKPTFLNEKIDK